MIQSKQLIKDYLDQKDEGIKMKKSETSVSKTKEVGSFDDSDVLRK